MDRFKLNTKALLGIATRTVDQDHEMRHTCVKTFYQAIAHYEAAMSKFMASVALLPGPLEEVEKAYKDVVANEEQVHISDGVREITSHLEEVCLNIIPDFVETFNTMVAPCLSTLKEDCDACERIHTERAKAVDLYDYHRDVVDKKEVHYAAKGKLLDDSKHYKEDLNRRDAANNEYLAKHSEYNKTYNELMHKKSELTALSVKVFAYGLLDFLGKLQNKVSRMCTIADNVSVNLKAEEACATPVTPEASTQVDVSKEGENEGTGEAENTATGEAENTATGEAENTATGGADEVTSQQPSTAFCKES